MTEKDKSKKPLHKKWWFWVIAIVIVGSWFTGDDKDENLSATNDQEKTEDKKTDESKDIDKKNDEKKEESENKKAEKEKDKKEESSKKKEKKKEDNRTIAEKIQEDDKNVDKAILKDGILTLEREPGGLWDENSLFHSVYDLFESMNEAFKDKTVDEVEVNIQTTMTDNKGNESLETVIEYLYTRETFKELNYDNFTNMAFGEQWRILNESDLYIIHPGIYKNLKGKYTDNLINGISKLPPVE